VLESTRRTDTIVLDKTGTVTTGRMSVTDVIPADVTQVGDLLRLAGPLEGASEHPIGRAVAAHAAAHTSTPGATVEDFRNHEGRGVSGVIDGHAVVIGRRRWLIEQWALTAPPALFRGGGAGRIVGPQPGRVGWDGQIHGVLVVADTVKPTSAEAVRDLIALGQQPVLLTGDNRRAAEAVAAEVGITEVHAEVLPADKIAVVRQL
jgi:Cu+-exporting ATPase